MAKKKQLRPGIGLSDMGNTPAGAEKGAKTENIVDKYKSMMGSRYTPEGDRILRDRINSDNKRSATDMNLRNISQAVDRKRKKSILGK